FDRVPDFFREGLSSNFDLRRRPEPVQNSGPRLPGAIVLEQVVRLVAALVARNFHIGHGGITCASERVLVSWPWPSVLEPCVSAEPCAQASWGCAPARARAPVWERPQPVAWPPRRRGFCARA